MILTIGDRVEMKKSHPCGCRTWEVVRTGADCKLKCIGCGHIALFSLDMIKKSVKKHIPVPSEIQYSKTSDGT